MATHDERRADPLSHLTEEDRWRLGIPSAEPTGFPRPVPPEWGPQGQIGGAEPVVAEPAARGRPAIKAALEAFGVHINAVSQGQSMRILVDGEHVSLVVRTEEHAMGVLLQPEDAAKAVEALEVAAQLALTATLMGPAQESLMGPAQESGEAEAAPAPTLAGFGAAAEAPPSPNKPFDWQHEAHEACKSGNLARLAFASGMLAGERNEAVGIAADVARQVGIAAGVARQNAPREALCGWCGQQGLDDAAAAREHVLVCRTHPMREVERDLAYSRTIREALAEGLTGGKRHVESLLRLIGDVPPSSLSGREVIADATEWLNPQGKPNAERTDPS